MKNWLQFILAAVLIMCFVGSVFSATPEEIKSVLTAYYGGEELTQAQLDLIQPYLEPQKPQFGPPSRGLLNEGFESGAIPNNWTVLNVDGGANQWVAQTANPNTGTYAARVKYETSSLQNDDWLITPPLDIQAGVNDTLKFWVRTYSGSYADPFEVKLSTTGTNPADFTVLLWDTTGYLGSYMQLVFPLDAYDGQVVYVGIHYTGFYDWYVYADDFEGPNIYLPPLPAFSINPDSANFGSINVGDTSATTTFTVTNTGGGTLTISSVSFTGTNASEFFATDTNTYPVDLANFETMSFDVQMAPTSLGDKSAFLTVVDNTTDATHNIPLVGKGISSTVNTYPYLEDFETFTVASNGTGFANNWSNDPTNTTSQFRWNVDKGGTPSSSTGPTVDHTLGTSAGIYLFTEASSGGTGDSAFVYSPDFDLSPLTNPTMQFWYHMYGAAMGEMHVDVFAGGVWNNDVMTPLIGQQQGSQTDPWAKATVDLSAYAGQTVSLRWRSYRGTSYTGDMAIDDVSVDEASLAPEFSVSPTSIDLNVEYGGLVPVNTPMNGTIYITNTGFANLDITGVATSSPDIVVSPTTLTIPPLATDSVSVTWTPSTVGMLSGWVEFTHNAATSPDSVTGTVHTIPTAAWAIDFEADYSTWFDPAGYNFTLHGASWSRSSSEHWGTYAAWKSGSTGKDTTYLYTPRLDLTAGATSVGFYRKGSTSYDDSVEVLLSTDLGATWTRVGVVDNSSSTYEWFSFDLSSYPQNDSAMIGFHYFYPTGSTSGSSFYMDDLMLPARWVPAYGVLYSSLSTHDFGTVNLGDTGSVAVDLTNTGALLTINSITSDNPEFSVSNVPATIGSGETKTFFIHYVPTIEGPDSATITIDHDGQNGTDDLLLITVKGTGFNATVSTYPYNEDFENGGAIPTGWVNDPLDSGKDWKFGTSAGHGPGSDHTTGTGYFAYLDDSSPNYTESANLISRPLDLTGLTNPTLDYWYWSFMDGGTAVPGYMLVDIFDGSTWHMAVDSIGQETAVWSMKSYNLTPYASSHTKVRFRVFETTLFYHDISIDDFVVYDNVSGTQKVLISEIVVTPTNGEYVEIYNPEATAVDLTDYYLTDATFASGNTYYYQIVQGGGGGGGFGDFHARFPAGASIAPGEYQTIALAGDSLFFDEYGVVPTYELYEDSTNFANDAPDMLEAFPGSINGQGGLTNGDEVVILYYWDGMSDLVKDVDYLIYDNAGVAPNESVDKTGVIIDGPDPDTTGSAYLPDTPIASQVPAASPGFGFSTHRIDYTEGAQVTSGGNGILGGDETSEDLNNTFTDNSVPSPNGPHQIPLPPGVFAMADFDNGLLPFGWSRSSNGVGWLIGDSASLSSTYWTIPGHGIFAAANDDKPGSGNDGSMDYLVTPPMDLSGISAAVVDFASFYDGQYGQLAYVEVSEDGGTTWTKIDSMVANGAWVPVTVDISGYTGSGHTAVQVAFHSDDGGGWASGWAVDDILVKEKDSGQLAGTVTVLSGGAPVDSALVTVNGSSVYTDPTGAYSFPQLFTGMYTVTVDKGGYNVAVRDSVYIYKDSTTVEDFALTAPIIGLDVTSITDTLMVGDTAVVPITVSNTGDGPLAYNLVVSPNPIMQTDYSRYQKGGTLSAVNNAPVEKRKVGFIANTTDGDTALIHYDTGYNNNGIGTGGAANWICAARFTAAELASYYGSWSITGVRFHIRDASFTNVTVKVWQGGHFGDPGVEVYSADVTSSVIVGDWTEHTLTTPVSLISGQEYWIGYAIDVTGDHPSSVDAGPMVWGKGAWMFFAGAWYQLTDLGASLNYNWNIRGILEPGNNFWLSAAPVSGVVLPGGNQVVNAKLDARVFSGDTTVHADIQFFTDPSVGNPIVPVDMTVQTPIVTIPPSNLSAQQIGYDPKVQLNWSHPMMLERLDAIRRSKDYKAAEEPQLIGMAPESFLHFNVYRAGSDMVFSQIATGVMDTSYVDSAGLVIDSTYYYQVTAFYDPEGESAPSNTAMVTLMGVPGEILLVDDDGSNGTGGYEDISGAYMAALTQLGTMYGTTFDYFEVPYAGDGPDAATMSNYAAVIWFTGETWSATFDPTLTANDEANLTTYLNGGGALFLCAQDYLYDAYPNAGSFSPGQFPYDFLGVASTVQDNWSTLGPLAATGVPGSFTDGMAFTVNSPFVTNGTFLYVDDLVTNVGSYLFSHTSPAGNSGVYYDGGAFRTVFSTLEFAGFVDGTPPSTKVDFLYEVLHFLQVPTSIEGDLAGIPTVFDLKPNYPNPFNPTTTIKYQLPQASDVRLDIFNILGQRVKTLVNSRVEPGYYEVVWDGTNEFGHKSATGVYIYRIQADDFVKSYKMILMK